MSVKCEEVRELLPEYAEWGPRPAGAVEVHIASCSRCGAELRAYRDMLTSLAAMRGSEEEPPDGYLDRVLGTVPQALLRWPVSVQEWREVPSLVVAAARRRPAAASLTGAAIGVAAIGLLAWRRGRKALRETAPVPGLASN